MTKLSTCSLWHISNFDSEMEVVVQEFFLDTAIDRPWSAEELGMALDRSIEHGLGGSKQVAIMYHLVKVGKFELIQPTSMTTARSSCFKFRTIEQPV